MNQFALIDNATFSLDDGKQHSNWTESSLNSIGMTMNSNEKTSIIAGLYGNALEWYDFLLYASFAPIFAEIFFPAHIGFVSLIATYSVFAIGFLVRPLGGALLG